MAIATDNVSTTGVRQTTAANSVSQSFTCTGSNLILFGFTVYQLPNTDDETGMTYNGVSMTRIATVLQGSNYRMSVYYLLNPATGSNTLQMNWTGNHSERRLVGGSYSGVAQTALDASNTFTGTGTSQSNALQTVADKCWMIKAVADNDTPGLGLTAVTNIVLREGIGNSGTGASDTMWGDSNGLITPAQSFTMATSGGNSSDTWAVIQFSFAPAGAAVVHNLGTLGVGA